LGRVFTILYAVNAKVRHRLNNQTLSTSFIQYLLQSRSHQCFPESISVLQ